MTLQTRQNPQTNVLEVLVNEEWVKFEDYRKKQIDDAYQNSVKFLRERLGEDSINNPGKTTPDEVNK